MHVGALICLDAWRKSHQLSLLRMSCWKLGFGLQLLEGFFFFYSLGVTKKATVPAWKLKCIHHQKAFICKLAWWGGGSNAACAKGWCTCRSCIGISVSEECGYSDVNGTEAVLRSITLISVAAQRLCLLSHTLQDATSSQHSLEQQSGQPIHVKYCVYHLMNS